MTAPDVAALPYLLTVPEVAALLRTSPKAVYLKIERGLLPGAAVVRDGRRVLLLRDEMLVWIRRRAASPGLGDRPKAAKRDHLKTGQRS